LIQFCQIPNGNNSVRGVAGKTADRYIADHNIYMQFVTPNTTGCAQVPRVLLPCNTYMEFVAPNTTAEETWTWRWTDGAGRERRNRISLPFIFPILSRFTTIISSEMFK
jgi:hypothetical protein